MTSQRESFEPDCVITDLGDDRLQYVLWEVHRPYGLLIGCKRFRGAARDVRPDFVLEPDGVRERRETHCKSKGWNWRFGIEFLKSLTSTGRSHALGCLRHVVGCGRVVQHSHRRAASRVDPTGVY